MAKRRSLKDLPEEPSGLTLSDLAREMTRRLGRPVRSQDVHSAAVARDLVPVGRALRMIPVTRREELLVVASRWVDEVERLTRQHLAARDAARDAARAETEGQDG